MSTRALVRRPGPRLADGLVTHIPRTSVDGDLAVISRPGADARRPEITGTEETLAALGQTNESGSEQLAALLAPLGAEAVGVPVSRVLNLESGVTALPRRHGDRVRAARRRPRAVALVPRRPGGGGVARGPARRFHGADVLEGCVTCLSVRLRG